MVNPTVYSLIGIVLLVVGIIIIIVAIVLAMINGSRKGKVEAAGVIMIGPIPIIFGTSKKSVKTAIMLALALTVMLVILYVVYFLFMR